MKTGEVMEDAKKHGKNMNKHEKTIRVPVLFVEKAVCFFDYLGFCLCFLFGLVLVFV